MTSLVATIVFVLLVTAWWSAAARTLGARTPGTRPAVFGRGEMRRDGRWHPVGAPEEHGPTAPGPTGPTSTSRPSGLVC